GIQEQFVEIKVKDTGIGIPKEDQDKIFERFFQHNIPGSVINQGSGIGLAITKEFIRLHHGTIAVESEPDKGTCFTVLLPVNAAETEPVIVEAEEIIINQSVDEEFEPVEVSNKGNRKRLSILIIDDNDDIRFYLKDNLRNDYQIT